MKDSERRSLPHAWVVYVAGLAPLCAIVFAFSLGPAPEKRVLQLQEADKAEASAVLDTFDRASLDLLSEVILQEDMPHREVAVRFLGERRHTVASDALATLCAREEAPENVRIEALHALERIDVERAEAAARALDNAPFRLRAEATRMLATIGSGESS